MNPKTHWFPICPLQLHTCHSFSRSPFPFHPWKASTFCEADWICPTPSLLRPNAVKNLFYFHVFPNAPKVLPVPSSPNASSPSVPLQFPHKWRGNEVHSAVGNKLFIRAWEVHTRRGQRIIALRGADGEKPLFLRHWGKWPIRVQRGMRGIWNLQVGIPVQSDEKTHNFLQNPKIFSENIEKCSSNL